MHPAGIASFKKAGNRDCRDADSYLFTILKYGRTTLSDWLPVLLEKYWSREEHQNKEFYYNGFVTLEVRDVTRVLLRWLAGA